MAALPSEYRCATAETVSIDELRDLPLLQDPLEVPNGGGQVLCIRWRRRARARGSPQNGTRVLDPPQLVRLTKSARSDAMVSVEAKRGMRRTGRPGWPSSIMPTFRQRTLACAHLNEAPFVARRG